MASVSSWCESTQSLIDQLFTQCQLPAKLSAKWCMKGCKLWKNGQRFPGWRTGGCWEGRQVRQEREEWEPRGALRPEELVLLLGTLDRTVGFWDLFWKGSLAVMERARAQANNLNICHVHLLCLPTLSSLHQLMGPTSPFRKRLRPPSCMLSGADLRLCHHWQEGTGPQLIQAACQPIHRDRMLEVHRTQVDSGKQDKRMTSL